LLENLRRRNMAKPEWHLGQTSAHNESHGPGTISSGKGDRGGVSYGTYQFSTSPDGGSLKEYLRHSAYKDQFNGLQPKTPEFDAKWKELAKNDPGFAQDQHNAIKKTHYDPMVAKLKAEGLDMSTRGPAVQDALWSTCVQFGPGHNHGAGGPDIFERGLNEKFGKGYDLSKLSDKDIVEAVQDYKIKHNEHLFSGSPKLLGSLEDRAKNEKAGLLQLASNEEPLKKNGIDVKMPDGAAVPGTTAAPKQPDALAQGDNGAAVRQLQTDLRHLGYTDAHGKSLHIDGDFGPATQAAVESFQRHHHLTIDGKADPQTLAALHAQTHAPTKPAAPGLDNPRNPDHALYEQALAGVRQLDAQAGRASDQHSANLAAALVVAAKKEGMTRIDTVVLSTDDGSRVFAVQNGFPLQKFANVPTLTSLNTPIEQSSAAVQQLNQQQAQQAAQPPVQPTIPTPTPPAPAMSR
jgi:peptidoglycan hydrolase-like protein with peptidoglycan-binding domain